MIAYLDPWLDKWAAWSRSGKERLGFASQSPIHKMMTSNAATTTGARHRGKRNSQHMKCVESVGKRSPDTEPDNPMCEMIDHAISRLTIDQIKIIKMKYISALPPEAIARVMKISLPELNEFIEIINIDLMRFIDE